MTMREMTERGKEKEQNLETGDRGDGANVHREAIEREHSVVRAENQ